MCYIVNNSINALVWHNNNSIMAKIRFETIQYPTKDLPCSIHYVIYRGINSGYIVVYGNRISQYSVFNYRGSDDALMGSVNAIVKERFDSNGLMK